MNIAHALKHVETNIWKWSKILRFFSTSKEGKSIEVHKNQETIKTFKLFGERLDCKVTEVTM